jgi:hypothetical protein
MENIFISAPANDTLNERIELYNFKTITSFNVFFGMYGNIGYCKVLLYGVDNTDRYIAVFVSNTIAKEHNLKKKSFTSDTNEGFLIYQDADYFLLPKLKEIYNEFKVKYPECVLNVTIQQGAIEETINHLINKKP